MVYVNGTTQRDPVAEALAALDAAIKSNRAAKALIDDISRVLGTCPECGYWLTACRCAGEVTP